MKCQFMQSADVKISMTVTVTFLANEMTSLPSGIHNTLTVFSVVFFYQ